MKNLKIEYQKSKSSLIQKLKNTNVQNDPTPMFKPKKQYLSNKKVSRSPRSNASSIGRNILEISSGRRGTYKF